jgi:hypothetical protein
LIVHGVGGSPRDLNGVLFGHFKETEGWCVDTLGVGKFRSGRLREVWVEGRGYIFHRDIFVNFFVSGSLEIFQNRSGFRFFYEKQGIFPGRAGPGCTHSC